MKLFSRCALAVALLVGVHTVQAEDRPVFEPPPRLATTRSALEKTKATADFPAVRAAAVKAADELLATPLVLPAKYGGWVFDYACPDDGIALKMITPEQHQCPRDKKIYTEERIVSAWRAYQHNAVDHGVEKLGWAYAYTGDERYATEAKRLLLELARAYPNYPARQDRWGRTGFLAMLGARRYVQSLDEAYGIIRLAKGYDLCRMSPVWTDADKTLVERDLFGLTADTLLTFNQDINNHQTWYNAGLMAIASVRGDGDLVRKVLNMRGGYRDQLNRSIGADGLWYEGTIAYHWYAMQAMFEIVDAGRRMGLPLQNEPKLRAMIDGPGRAAYPNGQMPAINDSDRTTIDLFRGAYSWAYKTYGDERYAPADGRIPVSVGSENLSDAGLAVLRRGTGANAVCVFLDYGQHGGGHGHYDKLQMLLYANGREWLLDPGRLSYSNSEYKTWVKETAAHNTVSLGGISQGATTGKLLWLQNEKDFVAVGARSDAAYEGAVLTRRLLLTDKFLVDVFDVETPKPTQIDWFAHTNAPLFLPVIQGTEKPEAAPFVPGVTAGYQHLKNGMTFKLGGDSRWDILSNAEKPEAPRLRIWLTGGDNETNATAVGIGYNTGEKAPALIRRRHAAKTRFVTAYDLSGDASNIIGLRTERGANGAIRLSTNEGNWKIQFTDSGATMVKVK